VTLHDPLLHPVPYTFDFIDEDFLRKEQKFLVILLFTSKIRCFVTFSAVLSAYRPMF